MKKNKIPAGMMPVKPLPPPSPKGKMPPPTMPKPVPLGKKKK